MHPVACDHLLSSENLSSPVILSMSLMSVCTLAWLCTLLTGGEFFRFLHLTILLLLVQPERFCVLWHSDISYLRCLRLGLTLPECIIFGVQTYYHTIWQGVRTVGLLPFPPHVGSPWSPQIMEKIHFTKHTNMSKKGDKGSKHVNTALFSLSERRASVWSHLSQGSVLSNPSPPDLRHSGLQTIV